jgi:hypothetical protein
MSLRPTIMFYPVESYNNRERSEQRWQNDGRQNWQISIKNGKRLRRHWTRNGGLAFVRTRYGEDYVYNSQYDTALSASENRSFYGSPGQILSNY